MSVEKCLISALTCPKTCPTITSKANLKRLVKLKHPSCLSMCVHAHTKMIYIFNNKNFQKMVAAFQKYHKEQKQKSINAFKENSKQN